MGLQWACCVWKSLLVPCKHVGACVVDVSCVRGFGGSGLQLFLFPNTAAQSTAEHNVICTPEGHRGGSLPCYTNDFCIMTQVAHNVFKGAQCEFKKEIWLVAMKWTDDSN